MFIWCPADAILLTSLFFIVGPGAFAVLYRPVRIVCVCSQENQRLYPFLFNLRAQLVPLVGICSFHYSKMCGGWRDPDRRAQTNLSSN